MQMAASNSQFYAITAKLANVSLYFPSWYLWWIINDYPLNMFTFSSKFTFSLVLLLWLAVMCGCFLTQKVPDKTWRSCQDEDDDDEDEAKQPFREAPPFMGRIRIGARYLWINMKHMNIHMFFSNNSTVLVVQWLLCYLRKTCARVNVLLSWFGSAVNPFPSSIINRTVISGSSSAPSVLIRVVLSRTQISHMFGSSHMFWGSRSASRCVCQSKVPCGSIVKYLLIWGQSVNTKATVSI